MKSSFDYGFERAIEGDDALDLRRARRKTARPEEDQECVVLHQCQTRCDQCGHQTWQPHVTAGRELCSRCCPVCARAMPRWLEPDAAAGP
jgi:hypothetical protein